MLHSDRISSPHRGPVHSRGLWKEQAWLGSFTLLVLQCYPSLTLFHCSTIHHDVMQPGQSKRSWLRQCHAVWVCKPLKLCTELNKSLCSNNYPTSDISLQWWIMNLFNRLMFTNNHVNEYSKSVWSCSTIMHNKNSHPNRNRGYLMQFDKASIKKCTGNITNGGKLNVFPQWCTRQGSLCLSLLLNHILEVPDGIIR